MPVNDFDIFQPERAVEDYINPEDGLLYCGKCHTPKQKKFDNGLVFGNLKTHPILCQCAAEQKEKEDAERREFARKNMIQQLRMEAFRDVPAALWRFESSRMTHQLEMAQRFVQHWDEFRKDGMGLLLFGDVGTGKSYAAGCVANALIEQGRSVLFVCLGDIVNHMQGCYGSEREDYTKSLLKPELLILDDLGAERNTSFGKEQVFDVINKRTLSGKPMIVTTNIPLHIMQNATDTGERRIYDRILAVCTPIRFDGENFRKGIAAENRTKAAALLRK